jgi:hypothetical protein
MCFAFLLFRGCEFEFQMTSSFELFTAGDADPYKRFNFAVRANL